MKVAALFGGGGLASLGLAQADHDVTSIELDPRKHALAEALSAHHGGAFTCVLADVRDVDLSGYDAVWASPPCKLRSRLNHRNTSAKPYSDDLVEWALALPHPILWVECTKASGFSNTWGQWWNAAQFTDPPLQQRNRLIGGRYFAPSTYHPYRRVWEGACPAITSRDTQPSKMLNDWGFTPGKFLGRPLTLDDMAYYQGLVIPPAWHAISCKSNIAESIANGVPVYMARAFGEVYPVTQEQAA